MNPVISMTDHFLELRLLRKLYDDEPLTERELWFLDELRERREAPPPENGLEDRL